MSFQLSDLMQPRSQCYFPVKMYWSTVCRRCKVFYVLL